MPVREGGSYVADPKSGEERRVEGTVHAADHSVETAEPVEVLTAPQPEPSEPPAPAPAEPGGASGRRGTPGKRD